jgi:uncharacterized protein (TIGR04141 family)
VKSAEDAVAARAKSHPIMVGTAEFGKLFVKKTPAKPPKWSKFFDGYVDRQKLGSVQSTAGVLIVPLKKRLFALTFGHGRFILRPEAIEERFGLLVTLNSIDAKALRSIDKRTFVDDQNSRTQTSQASAAAEFGIDVERDLIRGIVGVSNSSDLGKRFAGADALTVAVEANIPKLKKILSGYLQAFESAAYKKNFPWVDQVRQLHSNSPLVDELDSLLIEKLEHAWANNGRVDDCWLAIPDVVDWAVVKGFKFTKSPKEGVSSDLHLPGLVQAFTKDVPSIAFLNARYAMSVDDEEHPVDRWPVYRCIHCELNKDGKAYVLSAGKWFEIDNDFEKAVNQFVSNIDIYKENLLAYTHKDEGEYNEALAASSAGKWYLMDKKNLSVGGVHDKVEFCDLYGNETLLHIKHYGSSSVLGHLFNQGLVSGELLRSHPDYVALANAKLGSKHQLKIGKSLPRDVSSYSIVFAVISQSQEPGLHLPFFAKVALKHVCTRLRDLGYGNVLLAKIECDPNFVFVKKLRPKVPRKKTAVNAARKT